MSGGDHDENSGNWFNRLFGEPFDADTSGEIW